MEQNQNIPYQSQPSPEELPHEQNQTQTPPRKTAWWKFIVGFLVIISLGIIVDAVWTEYFSPAARNAARMKEQYAQYEAWQQLYDTAMAADTYGGKTPEETLALFIDALEKNDIDLASKYFLIDESLSTQKWNDFLNKIKNEGNLQRFATDLKQTPHETNTENENGGIIYLNSDGTTDLQISFKKISSQIWKIESL